MSDIQLRKLLCLFLSFILASHSYIVQGVRSSQIVRFPYPERVFDSSPSQVQGRDDGKMSRNSRRLMIGSTAPTCTYNECRGCKYKCRAEQVPVERNDPINSAYHYKCVCHRS